MKDKILSQAKITLLTKGAVFFSTILFNLKIKWNSNIPTACIDGITLTINEQFFESLNPNQRVFLLAHEVSHVALNHINRREDRDPVKYNKAGDYVINLILVNSGYEFIPEGLLDYKYSNLTTEQVYDLLEDDEQPYNCDIIEGDSSNSTQIEEILIKAIAASKLANESIGSITGESERILNELINPVLPWNELLQNYMDSFIKEDYSYRKPNRRYTDIIIIMPSLYSEGIESIIFAVDCSGSVSEEDFNKGIIEFNSIKEKLNPNQTHLITFDTKIKNTYVFQRDESIEDLKFVGWGGTILQPVFDYANEVNPTTLVVFSDLYCGVIDEEPNYPVIWICFNNPTATVNFGELIHYVST